MPPESLSLRGDLEGRIYPPFYFQGEDLLNRVEGATGVDELRGVVMDAVAFREGLTLGRRGYVLEDPSTLLLLKGLFTTVEGGVRRPESAQLDVRVRDRLEREIREIKGRAIIERRDLTEEEKGKIRKLTSLINFYDAHTVIDLAFVMRWITCESDDAQASLFQRSPTGRPSPKPDSVHWEAVLSGDFREFGERVDKVLREIIRMGMSPEELKEVGLEPVSDVPYTVYAASFTTPTFRRWLEHLLEAAEGDMYVVWFAWQLALLWEIPSSLGAREIDGIIRIGDPPIVSDLLAKICHCGHKRRAELGVNSRWERIRTSMYSCGHPLSLIPKAAETLCENFLREAKVKVKGKGTVSLWDLFWGERVSLADLPWVEIETQPHSLLDTEEVSSGSFGGWLLRRWRAFSVFKDLTTIPSLSDLANPQSFTQRAKNWDALFGEPGSLKPEDDPRVWWLLAILVFYYPPTRYPQRIKAVSKAGGIMKERGFKPQGCRFDWINRNPYDKVASPISTMAGTEKDSNQPVSADTILSIACDCGFLTEVGRQYILDSLKMGLG